MKGYLVIMLGLAVMASAFASEPQKKMSPELEAIFNKHCPGYKNFSINIYQRLPKQTGNLVISPLSTQYTLALILAGAKGRTGTEIRKALSYNLSSSESKKMWNAISKYLNCQYGNYKSSATNVIFVHKGFPIRDEYKAISEIYYHSQYKVLDFSRPRTAVQTINAYIKSQCPKIEKLLELSQVTKNTRLVPANTLNVIAEWQQAFNLAQTTPGIFHIAQGKTSKVNYMHSCRVARFGYDEMLGAKFLELPLAGFYKSIVFVLPDNKNGLPQMEAKMKQVLAFKDLEEEHVDIIIPRVNFQTHQDNLKPILQKLGMRRAFSPKWADLSGISTKKGLYLSIFVQKAFIRINEVGINAQAADATVATRAATNATQPQFKVNFHAEHPYLFYLKVAPGFPLLIGRVTTPEKYTEPVSVRNSNDNDDNDNDNNNNNDYDYD